MFPWVSFFEFFSHIGNETIDDDVGDAKNDDDDTEYVSVSFLSSSFAPEPKVGSKFGA